jgi:hypothetical protein
MNSYNKTYYLNIAELALLLTVGGMDSLYGIELDVEKLDKKKVYETIFGLQKKEMLCWNDNKLSLAYGIDTLISDIKCSKTLIIYLNSTMEYPQRFIYVGNRAVIISPYGHSGDILQVELSDISELPQNICIHGFMIEQVVNDESLYVDKPVNNELVGEKAERIFTSDINCMDENLWSNVVGCIRIMNITMEKCVKQYLLVQEGLNDYITDSDNQGTIIYAYSMKKILEMLTEALEGLM